MNQSPTGIAAHRGITYRSHMDPMGETSTLEVCAEQRATDGVRKYLFALSDGLTVETVVIPGRRRTTLCVSSQVGCAVGCTFCATATLETRRDLTATEIERQFVEADRLITEDPTGVDHRIENVVYMGMGEPFLNYDAVCESLNLLIRDHGFHSRIITVSTIGIPDRIVPFGRAFPHVRLAVSLHSPRDEERSELVPINRRYDLDTVLAACREYNEVVGRKVFFEYVLIRGRNDTVEHAAELAERLRGLRATVNLIPLHPGGVTAGSAPDRERSDAFRGRLVESFDGHVTFRRSRGLDIAAACGQLAAGANR